MQISTKEMIQTLKKLSHVEIDVLPSSGTLLYGLDGAEIRTESSTLIPSRNTIHRVYLRYGTYPIGWIINEDVTHCLICHIPFGYLTRKHHCRNCGIIICGNCSTHRAVIRQLRDEITSIFSRPESRVCDLCAAKHRLNEIWDAKPPPAPSPASAPSSPPPATRMNGANSEQSIASILETPTEQPTNPALNQYSDPVPLNLFPIINEETTEEDSHLATATPTSAAATTTVLTATATTESTIAFEETHVNSLPSQEQFSPSIHAFSVDDNEVDEPVSDDENSAKKDDRVDEKQLIPTQRTAARRTSWFEQKLGINLPGFSHEGESSEKVVEEDGEGGIDSDSEVDNGSSASGESVNSSRLSSRHSRSSRSFRRMNRTSDSYDESVTSGEYLPSPLNSPSSSYHVSSPQAFSSPSEDHEVITVSQLKLHAEQQRLIQLEKERKAEKLRRQQEQERLAAAAQSQVTPIKSRTEDHELSDQGLSPPVSSASSSPAMPGDSSLSSYSPSPAKRRSSLMWFFGMRDRGAPESEATKPSPLLRRGSDPGIIPPSRDSEDKRISSLSRESLDHVSPLPPTALSSEGPPSSPPLLSSKSLPL